MRRSPSMSTASYSLGPGPLTTALKALIAANVIAFLAQGLVPSIEWWFGLRPAAVVTELRVWQPFTYMFLHGGLFHLVFNMLALWMFGTELERTWGTRFFLKFYTVTGVGAGLLTVVVAWLPFGFAESLRYAIVIGASGAIFGLLLAYALYFPNRMIYLYFLFPIPVKYFVMIVGAISLYSSLGPSTGVASITHLGGLVVGYVYLKGARFRPLGELQYWYLRWRMHRTRRRFDVYTGGRSDDWNRRVH
jgi:membrane associated rhomboid family serine protease